MPRTKKHPQRMSALAEGPADVRKMQVKGRVWIEKDNKTYLSWARVELLERIDQEGSVSAAARSMEMSYSHAWGLVQEMNHLAPKELVSKTTGGKGGGGARLTKAGRLAIADFWQVVRRFRTWVSGQHIQGG
jgi:molybdate transport system regulatory protein